MESIGTVMVGITVILAAMLVSVNGQPPTRTLSLGATTLVGVVLPREGAVQMPGYSRR